MERATFELEVKSFGDEGTFEGYLSTYDVDLGGDRVLPGAFKKTLREWAQKKKPIPLLIQHDQGKPAGYLEAAYEEDRGLKVSGKLMLQLSQAKDYYELLKAGVIGALSMGYSAVKWSIENEVRLLKEVKLYEASLVLWPMNESAVVTAVKGEDGDFTVPEPPTPQGAGTQPPEPGDAHSEADLKAVLRTLRRTRHHIASKL